MCQGHQSWHFGELLPSESVELSNTHTVSELPAAPETAARRTESPNQHHQG